MQLFVAVAFLLGEALAQDGNCFHATKNRTGVCVEPWKCPSSYLEAEAQPCGSGKMVCCAPVKAGTISAAKCLEYSKLDLGKCPIRPEPTNRMKAFGKEFPHMAFLTSLIHRRGTGITCTGALISSRFVITAGYCVNSKFGKIRYVHLGDLHLNKDDDNAAPKVYKVEKMYSFPGLRNHQGYHDVGLVRLDEEVVFSEYIKPICLHSGSEVKVKEAGVTSGWGRIGSTYHMDFHLRRQDVFVEDVETCRTLFGRSELLPDGVVDEVQLCVGSNSSECVGSAGSPLEIVNQDVKCMYSMVGLLSVGMTDACGAKVPIPHIYTRLEPYLAWIESIVWSDNV